MGGLTLLTGGKVQIKRGVLEFYGGFTTWFLTSPVCGAKAMTLGHVILGRDKDCLDENREHEHGHVRQAETWGILFLPAYLAASLWALLRGKHHYTDNWFEKDADQTSKDNQ